MTACRARRPAASSVPTLRSFPAERLAERGVVLTYETIRQWGKKFGQEFANDLHTRRPRPGDKRHMDEVFIRIS